MTASEGVGLTMNLTKTKTKILAPNETLVYVKSSKIEKVKEYGYLSHEIKLDKENQKIELSKRIRMT